MSPSQMVEHAQTAAGSLIAMPESHCNEQLTYIKADNPVMWALVRAALEDMRKHATRRTS